METHDGFTTKEWLELAQLAVERSSDREDWLTSANLSKAMMNHQLRLRERAAKKFSDPDRWLWTEKLFEQSSDEKVAALAASALPPHAHVIDFCSGAGSDSIAIARRGTITAVDRCPVACGLTKANLAMHFPDQVRFELHQVVCENAESVTIGKDTWIHIDPDRRSQSKRTIQASQFQPGLEFLAEAMEKSAGGSIKLAPATKVLPSNTTGNDKPATRVNCDFEKIGRQFIAWGNSVRQQRWWWNVEAYPGSTITISVLDHEMEWYHWTVANDEVGEFDEWSNIVEDWREIQGYVGDAESCVRAAGLQGLLANQIHASIIGNPVGYFHKDQLVRDQDSSPLIDWFQVDATMAFDRKRLRTYLREKSIGILEIKVRNVEITPESLRKELRLLGSEAATLLVTKCGSKTVAIVARRV